MNALVEAKVIVDFPHDIAITHKRLHGFRSSEHVHQNHSDLSASADVSKLGISVQGGDVINNFGPGHDCELRDG